MVALPVPQTYSPRRLELVTAVESIQTLRKLMVSMKDTEFKSGVDYDQLPGMQKPTLLLPGMEKIMRVMSLRPRYIESKFMIIDFAKPLFHFDYECELVEIETGLVVASARGSCNSMESKYRFRKGERACPDCNQPTIKKSKKGNGGWYCHGGAGGCWAEFSIDDPRITDQQTGRIENPDIFDQVNTLEKMAQKRALGSAVKNVAAVSEFFTVDLEKLDGATSEPEERAGRFDEPGDRKPADKPNGAKQPPQGGKTQGGQGKPSNPPADMDSLDNESVRTSFFKDCKDKFGLKPGDVMKELGVTSLMGMKRSEAINKLEAQMKPATTKTETPPKTDEKKTPPSPITPPENQEEVKDELDEPAF